MIQVNAPAVPVRFFSPTPTAIQEVADRIFYILSLFDKIDQEKLSLDCRFDKVYIIPLYTQAYAIAFQNTAPFESEVLIISYNLFLTFDFRIWDWTVQIQLKLQWQSRMNSIWKFQSKPWIFFWNVLELIVGLLQSSQRQKVYIQGSLRSALSLDPYIQLMKLTDEILELSKTLKDSTRINRSYLR